MPSHLHVRTSLVAVLLGALLAPGCRGSKTDDARSYWTRQSTSRVAVRTRGKVVRSLRATLPAPASAADPVAAARAVLTQHRAKFGLVDPEAELRLAGTAETPDGTVVRLARVHRGVEVLGAEVVVHVNQRHEVTYIGASLPSTLELEVEPTIARPDAIATAARAVGGDPALRPLDARLVVLGDELGGDGDRLAWLVELGSAIDLYQAAIDARDGAVLFAYDASDDARRQVTCAGIQPDGSCKQTWFTEAGQVAEGAPHPKVRAAHEQAAAVHDWFQRTLDRDSWDGAGAPIRTIVTTEVARARWVSTSNTILVNPNYVALDVIAHEFAHGVVNHHTHLIKGGAPGAISESMADVFGSLIEGNWVMGEATPKVVRDLTKQRNNSEYENLRRHDWGKDNDNGHQHKNSRILTHAAFLMSEGCPGNADYCRRIDRGIGRAKTARIYYAVLRTGLTSWADFEDVRAAAALACQQMMKAGLHGITAADCGVVINAFHSVGIGEKDRDKDGYDDHEDNCGGHFNPDQTPSKEDPHTGERCIHEATDEVPDDLGDPEPAPEPKEGFAPVAVTVGGRLKIVSVRATSAIAAGIPMCEFRHGGINCDVKAQLGPVPGVGERVFATAADATRALCGALQGPLRSPPLAAGLTAGLGGANVTVDDFGGSKVDFRVCREVIGE